jgi:hypothetical protein
MSNLRAHTGTIPEFKQSDEEWIVDPILLDVKRKDAQAKEDNSGHHCETYKAYENTQPKSLIHFCILLLLTYD